jgi:hypothetical protein
LVGVDPSRALWFRLGAPERVEFIVREIYCLAFMVASSILCSKVLNYDRLTRMRITELRNKLDSQPAREETPVI